MATTQAAVSTKDVKAAALELASMRRSLGGWLKYRTINDSVMAGTVMKIRKPLGYAQRVVASRRDPATEADLAQKLYTLLDALEVQNLPDPSQPNAAVTLAQIAMQGSTGVPVATGGFMGASHPWLWPVLIVGGLLIAVTTAIKSSADVAKDQEQTACIEAGACTDYGFWLKAGGIAALVYILWREGGRDIVRDLLKKGRS